MSTNADVRQRVEDRYGGFLLTTLIKQIQNRDPSVTSSDLLSHIQRTQRCAKMMEKLDNKQLVMEATQLVNSMFKPSKSMKKEDTLKGFSEQDD